jgi:hypothetical protein
VEKGNVYRKYGSFKSEFRLQETLIPNHPTIFASNKAYQNSMEECQKLAMKGSKK